ncbi:hypothetical protein CEXT_162621 [Caerostris extrusa]|uniref:Maturase K n=1 Tax=Caerostris extrusa TaxID=172846 RepID=A0AAV4N1T7_CAEEX|nr:hypothetical protein CEXT_162621 [Caerostris extrusa]
MKIKAGEISQNSLTKLVEIFLIHLDLRVQQESMKSSGSGMRNTLEPRPLWNKIRCLIFSCRLKKNPVYFHQSALHLAKQIEWGLFSFLFSCFQASLEVRWWFIMFEHGEEQPQLLLPNSDGIEGEYRLRSLLPKKHCSKSPDENIHLWMFPPIPIRF